MLKIDYLKTQPAPVLINCTQRAFGANQKCGSVKGTKTLWRRGNRYGVGESAFLTILDLCIMDVCQHLTKVPHVMVPMLAYIPVLSWRPERAFSACEHGSSGTLSV